MESAPLRCIYGTSSSKWLRLGPLKVHIYWKDPQILVIKELMHKEECQQAITEASAKLKNWDHQYGNRGVPWNKIRVMKK